MANALPVQGGKIEKSHIAFLIFVLQKALECRVQNDL